jgi:hypothetical protein
MNSSSQSWHAYATAGPAPNPLPRLVELLLDLLLNDVPGGRSAQLTGSAGAEGADGGYAVVGDPDQPGRPVSASAPLPNGGTLTLTVRGELADDEPTQAQLQRFIRPLVAAVALEHQLDRRSGQARDAVAQIERLAVSDLATGIVMVQRDCDPAKARELLAGWSARAGHDLQSLSAVRILQLLTADPA